MNAYHPNGEPIVGTLESLQGQANISPGTFEPGDDGTLSFDYDGTTDIHWNTQMTQREGGQRLLVAEDGAVCKESDAVLKSD